MVKVVGRRAMWNSSIWIVLLLAVCSQGSSDYFISHPDHRVAPGEWYFASFVTCLFSFLYDPLNIGVTGDYRAPRKNFYGGLRLPVTSFTMNDILSDFNND